MTQEQVENIQQIVGELTDQPERVERFFYEICLDFDPDSDTFHFYHELKFSQEQFFELFCVAASKSMGKKLVEEKIRLEKIIKDDKDEFLVGSAKVTLKGINPTIYDIIDCLSELMCKKFGFKMMAPDAEIQISGNTGLLTKRIGDYVGGEYGELTIQLSEKIKNVFGEVDMQAQNEDFHAFRLSLFEKGKDAGRKRRKRNG